MNLVLRVLYWALAAIVILLVVNTIGSLYQAWRDEKKIEAEPEVGFGLFGPSVGVRVKVSDPEPKYWRGEKIN